MCQLCVEHNPASDTSGRRCIHSWEGVLEPGRPVRLDRFALLQSGQEMNTDRHIALQKDAQTEGHYLLPLNGKGDGCLFSLTV